MSTTGDGSHTSDPRGALIKPKLDKNTIQDNYSRFHVKLPKLGGCQKLNRFSLYSLKFVLIYFFNAKKFLKSKSGLKQRCYVLSLICIKTNNLKAKAIVKVFL